MKTKKTVVIGENYPLDLSKQKDRNEYAKSDAEKTASEGEEEYPPYAISTSDGHDEDWTYYDGEKEAREAFIFMQEYEDDIHLCKLTSNNEYEVIDSYWVEDTV